MYTRTGYRRRDIREEYRRNPEEYTIHQHHGINNINIKEEIRTMVAVQGADSGGRRTSRRRGLDPEQDGSWKDWKKEGVMEGVSAPGWKDRRRKKNGLYCTQYRGGSGHRNDFMLCIYNVMLCRHEVMLCRNDVMLCSNDVILC
jgi:hypothetical protein